jgi:hypothetical protein
MVTLSCRGDTHMSGNGWQPEYGISAEGTRILAYVEVLPREAREELLAKIAAYCKEQGYLSLNDDLSRMVNEQEEGAQREGKVLPFRRADRG